jgi:hypothetical protein
LNVGTIRFVISIRPGKREGNIFENDYFQPPDTTSIIATEDKLNKKDFSMHQVIDPKSVLETIEPLAHISNSPIAIKVQP